MARITLIISDDESKALIDLSQRERRWPRDQAALLLRHALELAGYLPVDSHALSPQPARAGYMNNEVRT